MHLPDSPAWKSKQSKKKKALQEQQEKYVTSKQRSHSEPAFAETAQRQQQLLGTPKGRRSNAAGNQTLPRDDLFAAMVLRQAHLRKRAAGLQHRRFAEPPRLNSKGEIVEVRDEDCEARQLTHQECAAEIISELAGAAKGQSHSQILCQDLQFADRSWTPTRRDIGSRNRNSSQHSSLDDAELCLSPWEMLVRRHRRHRRRAEAAVAAQEETDPGPAALEKQHGDSDSEASSASMEEPKVQPSVPSWDCPSKEPPPPPPMPPHWQEFHDRKKEHENMEKEKELKQRERRERERERRARKQESQDKIKQEYAWQDGQKKRKRRGQATSESSFAPTDTNTSDSEIEASSPAWRPWRCLFPRRHPGKVKLPGRSGRWGRGWQWSNAKVAPEWTSTPGDEEPDAAQEGARPIVNLLGDNLLLEIDEELDRSRGLSQQERKRIFRELQRRIHPDKNLADQDAAKLAFQYLMDNRTSFLKS
eukprot:TRINITY_DN74626_c0_g1_i1.p1 TRINITY_DN74626_c0_g1~~TRINITY_DN74626_c0_g1_i1.p1  ORF type:complete len:475 (+),score=92.12 TRINITY_DN74626_c0_g1_i1:105-1529(+)